MEKAKIHIPKPCHENWDKMSTLDKGKHCNVCQKSVIDFTSMSGKEIIEYLNSKKNERVCGRFLRSQVIVKRPKSHEILIDLYQKMENHSNIRFFNQFSLFMIIACMLLVGCDVPKHNKKHKNGEIENSIEINLNREIDTNQHVTMGLPFELEEIKPQKDSTISNHNLTKDSIIEIKSEFLIEEIIVGDIEMIVDSTEEEMEIINLKTD